ncbi:ferritin-like fold-containing protein [Isoptericola variabilis]|uniref:Ferritin-like domain-containing protein n=1 Tax=Isoptericola variabilis (strain 225) TaxID=743718 RepID=F6FXA7_ISOV2|nr:ferritin-like fold-containing protein [Isoptericola variabilis]AEG43610.1 hypothetical protein Isova_0824 [Isoptericola variabilis 225]TWH32022.1 tRNA-(MS[2]IO[6]A)-hydroxylase MiaE-like protein [Isoptericola variabilis J7]
MSEHRSTPPSAASTTASDGGPQALLELLGLASYTELATFGLLASRSVDAPDLATRQTLAEAADQALGRQLRLLELASGHGVGAVDLMTPFDGSLTDFDARTQPGSWWEGLLKGAVGHGVAADLCTTLARGLPDGDAAAVLAVVEDATRADTTLRLLTDAAARDDVLASRLALWGRRVVGEALTLVQALLTRHPRLADLARSAAPGDAPAAAGDVPSWLLAALTAEHTRRMDRIGLAA